MGKVWYCLIDGKSLGPVDSSELKGLADRGTLRPTHYVRQNTGDEWTLAVQVRGLFPTSTNPGGERQTAPPQQARWIVRTGGREYGPYTDNQLRRYTAEGYILPNYDVRLTARTEWVKAHQIKNLFPPQLSTKLPPQPSSVATTKLRFTCPSCGKYLQCPAALTGKSLPCPACRATVLVPTLTDRFSANSKATVAVPAADAPETPRPVHEEPVLVQEPKAIRDREKISGWSLKNILGGLSFNVSTGDDSHGSTDDSITFYGPGSTIDFGYWPLHDPLVYATQRDADFNPFWTRR